MVRLHFLRHGQTPHSRDDRYCGAATDPDLTEEGKEMAAAFARAYRGLPWAGLFSSPQRRARQTVAPLAAATGLEVQPVEGLQEIAYGEWEGLKPAEVESRYHDAHLRWEADPAWHAPPGGETAIELARRAVAAVDEVRRRVSDGSALVVAHKGTIRALLCAFLGIDVGRFRQRIACPVGSVSVVEFGRRGPLLVTLADRSHLDERLRELPGT
jgi:probable phosphoglycerate mutase